jgi:tyrosyl-tRNA synthetase
VQDADVERFLLMFTFLPVEECKRLAAGKDAEINLAKEKLAWEVTAVIHGADEANKALQAARAAFGGGVGDIDEIPSISLPSSRLEAGIGVLDLFLESKLASSKSDARRLVQQGGAAVNGKKVTDEGALFFSKDLEEGALFLRAGKKRVCRILVG